MGIPSFARVIVEKYKNTHSGITRDPVDHFFIDFNCIVYNCYASLDKSKFSTLSNAKIENLIIDDVVKYLQRLINLVKPTKSVYIAIDGPAPCAKVQQQRFRRFKTILLTKLRSQIHKKHNVPVEKGWNTSCNIAPGTRFMMKLSKAIASRIKSGYYSKYTEKKISFTLSDSNVPGEGEHKYMDLLRDFEKSASDERVVVYSPDADVIVL